MSEFKVIETQEELDKIIAERLKRERNKVEEELKEKLKTYETQIQDLKAENAETKANLEKASEKDSEIEKLQGQIKGYEKSEMQRKIALENKIPYNLAGRIQGETEEEMLEDAKSLSKYFEKQEVVPPLKNPEINNGQSGAYKELLQGLNLED
ncbi:hypothetical protein HMPREF9130_1232 [Peptoniphilus sp. oral taxon 375 str. F0436]|nr:hypothetical protein HMPREF9130_1232 [Peptoniphilus sp. oral taxon 375 str. F0436]